MNKLLLFLDWHGTLSQGQFWSHLSMVQRQAIQTTVFNPDSAHLSGWMRGSQSSEGICELLAQPTGLTKEGVLRELQVSCENFVLADALGSLLKNLRQKFTLILVTDNMDCFIRFVVPALHLEEVFDEIYSSSEHGLLKTDQAGKIFKDIANKHESSLQDAFLVDDSVETGECFAKLGGTYKRTQSLAETKEILTSLLNL